MVIRVRRQITSEVDAPSIEKLAFWRDGNEYRRVAVLSGADGRRSMHSCSRHVVFLRSFVEAPSGMKWWIPIG